MLGGKISLHARGAVRVALLVALLGVARPVPAGDYLYTVSNAVGSNEIHGFRVTAWGKLVPLEGSPWKTGGKGVGFTPFTQNGVVVTEDARYLLAANPVSGDIAVFRIRRGGGLEAVPGSPFSTGGAVPVSIALSRNLLYVGHVGPRFDICVDCDYRGFTLDRRRERLVPIRGSVLPLPEDPPAFPLALQFTPDHRFVIASRAGDHLIDVLRVDPKSKQLSRARGSPHPAVDPIPIGFAFHPRDASIVYVSNSVDLEGVTSTVSKFRLNGSGRLDLEGHWDVGQQRAACWIALTSDGRHLYTANTNGDTLSHFAVDDRGDLQLQEVVPVPRIGSGLHEPVDLVVTRGNRFLYVTLGGVGLGGIAGYRIGPRGRLSLLPGPQPARVIAGEPGDVAAPFGLVYVSRPGL